MHIQIAQQTKVLQAPSFKMLFILIFAALFSVPALANSTTKHSNELIQAPHQVTQKIVERVEPPSWWVGMKQTQLQLIIYGKNVGKSIAKTHYAGVRVISNQSLENPNYLVVNLNIEPTAQAGNVLFSLVQSNKKMGEFSYQLEARKNGSAQRTSFTPADAIYLLMPDRFANGDSSNDNHPSMRESANRQEPGGRHGGDILGIRQHLNYIAQLGFTMIWSTPLLENNQATYSYHGYSATDFYQVDPRYGSNEDYRLMVKEAKQLGIGFIHDVVLNHIGSFHWWMKDLPSTDWLNYPKQYTETNHIRSTVQDPHAAQADRDKFAQGWFTQTMPDLNQRNPYLANYLIQNTLWWIEYTDLSGIRTDTYSYSDRAFLAQWSKRITQEYPHINIVGEEWSMNPAIVAYWQKDKVNQDGYRSYVPSMMDFSVYENLHKSLLDEGNKKADISLLYQTIANDFQYAHPENLTIFEGNHDTPRLFSQLDEDIALNKMAMMMLATLRGIPQMFYGTELLMTSPRQRDDGKVRGDFPGGWKDDVSDAFQQRNLTQEQEEFQSFIRQLFNWRKTATAVHNGKLIHFIPENNCYVYFRTIGKQKIMVVANRLEQDQTINLHRFNEVIQSQKTGKDVLTGQSVALDTGFVIKAKSAMIIDISI